MAGLVTELAERFNGMPGLIGTGGDGVTTVISFTVDDGRIVAIDIQRNPEKLRRLP
jgi:RNA polymerase sigma-70 factor, ECF subfamily